MVKVYIGFEINKQTYNKILCYIDPKLSQRHSEIESNIRKRLIEDDIDPHRLDMLVNEEMDTFLEIPTVKKIRTLFNIQDTPILCKKLDDDICVYQEYNDIKYNYMYLVPLPINTNYLVVSIHEQFSDVLPAISLLFE
jgi:hypothetical protein